MIASRIQPEQQRPAWRMRWAIAFAAIGAVAIAGSIVEHTRAGRADAYVRHWCHRFVRDLDPSSRVDMSESQDMRIGASQELRRWALFCASARRDEPLALGLVERFENDLRAWSETPGPSDRSPEVERARADLEKVAKEIDQLSVGE